MNGPDPLEEISSAIKLSRSLRKSAEADLIKATPTLQKAIATHSGQGDRARIVLLSLWNEDQSVNLCDALSGLDAKLAKALVAAIAARAHLGGDADQLLRRIINP